MTDMSMNGVLNSGVEEMAVCLPPPTPYQAMFLKFLEVAETHSSFLTDGPTTPYQAIFMEYLENLNGAHTPDPCISDEPPFETPHETPLETPLETPIEITVETPPMYIPVGTSLEIPETPSKGRKSRCGKKKHTPLRLPHPVGAVLNPSPSPLPVGEVINHPQPPLPVGEVSTVLSQQHVAHDIPDIDSYTFIIRPIHKDFKDNLMENLIIKGISRKSIKAVNILITGTSNSKKSHPFKARVIIDKDDEQRMKLIELGKKRLFGLSVSITQL